MFEIFVDGLSGREKESFLNNVVCNEFYTSSVVGLCEDPASLAVSLIMEGG